MEQLQQYEEHLKQSEAKITELQLALERLQVDKPDVAKLMTEIESGKVGASRAVAQNMELKAQLEEMQKAFVQIVSFVTNVRVMYVNESNLDLFFLE